MISRKDLMIKSITNEVLHILEARLIELTCKDSVNSVLVQDTLREVRRKVYKSLLKALETKGISYK